MEQPLVENEFIETYHHVRILRGEDGFHASAGCAVHFGYCDTLEEIRAEIDDHWAEDDQEPPIDSPALDTSFHDHEMDVGDEPRCTSPSGHKWAYSGSAYGGDDDSYHGEGRCYCEHCGADGDA